MRLGRVVINNFRSLADCRLELSSLTPMVGYNNAGKTSALDAISWVVEPYVLEPDDFFDSSSAIVIEGVFEELTDADLSRLAAKHRSKLSPFVVDGVLRIRRTQRAPGGRKTDIQLELFKSEDEGVGAWLLNPTGISQALSALLPALVAVKAMDDAAADISKVKSTSTIGRLVAEITEPLRAAHGDRVTKAFADIRRVFGDSGEERADELRELDGIASTKVQEFFPGLEVTFHFPTPSLDDLIGSGTLRVRDGEQRPLRELSSMGHGAQRSIQMALIRHLADLRSESASGRPILFLIDEPELYLHPQAVEATRAALRALSKSGYQIVFTTHSPRLVTVDEIGSAVIMGRDDGGRSAPRKRLREAVLEVVGDAPAQTRTLFELGNASEVFFSDRIVLVEGDADARVVRALFRAWRGCDPAEFRIGTVVAHGAGGVANSLRVLEAMGISACAVVDLDYVARDAVKADLVESDDARLESLREICARRGEDLGFATAEDGFPTKSSRCTAEEGFALLAGEEEAQPLIDSLTGTLAASFIWCWPRGSMEHHLGVRAKTAGALADFLIKLDGQGAEAVKDPDAVSSLLAFIDRGEETAAVTPSDN